jgi:hypothetical protein
MRFVGFLNRVHDTPFPAFQGGLHFGGPDDQYFVAGQSRAPFDQ